MCEHMHACLSLANRANTKGLRTLFKYKAFRAASMCAGSGCKCTAKKNRHASLGSAAQESVMRGSVWCDGARVLRKSRLVERCCDSQSAGPPVA